MVRPRTTTAVTRQDFKLTSHPSKTLRRSRADPAAGLKAWELDRGLDLETHLILLKTLVALPSHLIDVLSRRPISQATEDQSVI